MHECLNARWSCGHSWVEALDSTKPWRLLDTLAPPAASADEIARSDHIQQEQEQRQQLQQQQQGGGAAAA